MFKAVVMHPSSGITTASSFHQLNILPYQHTLLLA